MRCLSVLVAVALLLSSCGDGLREFKSPAGDYTMDFPGEPTRYTEQKDIHGHTVVENGFSWRASLPTVSASYIDWPPAIMGDISTPLAQAEAYKRAQASLARMPGAVILRTGVVISGEYDGREVVAQKGTVIVVIRQYLKGYRAYTISAAYEAGDSEAERVALKCLDSFKIR